MQYPSDSKEMPVSKAPDKLLRQRQSTLLKTHWGKSADHSHHAGQIPSGSAKGELYKEVKSDMNLLKHKP